MMKTCADTGGSSGQRPTSISQENVQEEVEKVYGYIDTFKTMGAHRPHQTYPVTLKSTTIGRDHSCQIRISNARVSRHQCSIVVSDELNNLEIHLQNQTSRSTTVHNNKTILVPGGQVSLQHGDRFRIFDVEFRWRKYDPVDEQGQLDWSRPIPIVRLATPPPQPPPQKSPPVQRKQLIRPVIQSHRKQLSLPLNTNNSNKSLQDQRRKSCPPSMTTLTQQLQQNRMDRLKVPRWPSLRLLYTTSSSSSPDSPLKSNNNNNNNRNNQQQQQQNLKNLNNKNNKNLTPTPLIIGENNNNNNNNKKRSSSSSSGGNVSYKRRGSADHNLRKAVLQRSFRRAFKDKIQNGALIDVSVDSRFRQCLEGLGLTDMIVLSSAA